MAVTARHCFSKTKTSLSPIIQRFCSQSQLHADLKPNQKQSFSIDMDNVSENALSAFKTMYMRYKDTEISDPILNDKLSTQYMNSFVYEPHHLPPSKPNVASILEPYRAKIIDLNLIQWIETRYANHILNIEKKTKDQPQIVNIDDSNAHKSVLHVIELGVGFDTRFERIFLSESNTSKKIEDSDYFMEAEEIEKLKQDDDERFEEIFHSMPGIAEMDNTVSYNDYDVVYYYELDLNELIKIRKSLHEHNKVNALIHHHNNEHLLGSNNPFKSDDESSNHSDSERMFTPKIMGNVQKRVYRKMYSYSVHDVNWYGVIKRDIARNHEKETGKAFKRSGNRNVCIVCESLFLFMSKREMKEVIENCCNTFTGAHFICDESFTNEGLMNIEKEILTEQPMSFDITNKVFMFKLDEVLKRLSFMVRWSIAWFAKNNYKILAIQFMKPTRSEKKADI